ncbi:Rieske 2Fe-2S domain-containing protein [Variovorax sp. GB1R11]|uniref:Rieske 2Fe-2S domain-containing protein n=1 Tax=Variovorax sp. GB1R11 TaxID=3443741 RepID=UPI003F476680
MPVEQVQQGPAGPLPDGFLPPNCTFAAQDWQVLARLWFPVSRVDEATASPRQVTLLNLRLAVYRMPEGVRIGRDMCPHRGLPLSTGRIDDDQLVCAYHGLRFDADGQCLKVPEKLAPKPAACFRVTMFPAVERYGLVWTCLAPEDEPVIPHIPSKIEATVPGGPASEIQLQVEDWMNSAKFDFPGCEVTITPSHCLSLRALALNEYRRLFDTMGLTMAAHALPASLA